MCLVKDPSKRPSAEKLLKHSFFKHVKSADYIARTILDPLPPLWQRVRDVKVIYLFNSYFLHGSLYTPWDTVYMSFLMVCFHMVVVLKIYTCLVKSSVKLATKLATFQGTTTSNHINFCCLCNCFEALFFHL